jgi:hypothetical protein
MPPRCEGKFVGMDEVEIEVQSSEINGDQVTIEVLVQRMCNNCGSSAEECSMAFEDTIEHTHERFRLVERALDNHLPEDEEDFEHLSDEELAQAILGAMGESEMYDLEGEPEATPTDRYGGTTKKGKPITNPRYQTHYIGADIEVGILCHACGETFTVSGTVEEPASAFEDTQHSG